MVSPFSNVTGPIAAQLRSASSVTEGASVPNVNAEWNATAAPPLMEIENGTLVLLITLLQPKPPPVSASTSVKRCQPAETKQPAVIAGSHFGLRKIHLPSIANDRTSSKLLARFHLPAWVSSTYTQPSKRSCFALRYDCWKVVLFPLA